MFNVVDVEEAGKRLSGQFTACVESERVTLSAALGRTLSEDVISREFVPDFHRSMVDGYAVRAADTFGCSEAIPALLHLEGEVLMGRSSGLTITPGTCAYVPTGGEIPFGADAMAMLEYAENYGDGVIAIQRPVAPGGHIIFRGDDVKVGDCPLPRGRRVRPSDVGSLAALGYDWVKVFRRPGVAVLSTGDELVPVGTETLQRGQIRDVNGLMLYAALEAAGAKPERADIVPDNPVKLDKAIDQALRSADMVILSGGSSVGVKDMAEGVLTKRGSLLFHGLALKPGKPTLAANLRNKPVFVLPGHPVAAFFVYTLLVRPLK